MITSFLCVETRAKVRDGQVLNFDQLSWGRRRLSILGRCKVIHSLRLEGGKLHATDESILKRRVRIGEACCGSAATGTDCDAYRS
jgi:hypothetical protein